MSFFIDEINFLAGIDLFKVKPDYQVRDEIETKISAILPYKHTVSVEGSDIKVEVFHSDVTDEQLAKIGTVINDTFKVCQKYAIISSDKNVNLRMFLFEDREQYVDMKKSLYASDTSDQEAGVTIPNPDPLSLSFSIIDPSFKNDFPNYLKSPSDVLIYAKDNFSNYSKSFEEIDYHTLAHEFIHCIQRIVTQLNKAVLSKPVTEGSANLIACEALHEEETCKMLENFGSCKIKSHDLNLGDVYYARSPIVNEDPYTTGMAMFKFLEEKHPEIIDDISEYFMLGDNVKWHDIFNKIWDIDNKNPEEFKEWLDNQDTQYTKCDSSMDIIHGLTSFVDIL